MNRYFFIITVICFSLTSCRFITQKKVRGNGQIESQARTVNGFDGAEVSGAIDLYIIQDSVNSVRVETDQNLLPYVETIVEGNTLRVYADRGYNLKPSQSIKVYVSGPAFSYLDASGACQIHTQGPISHPSEIRIHASGASVLKLEVNAPSITTDLSGASDVHLRGQTKSFIADASGASTIKGFDLMSENSIVDLSGASSAEVFASVKLDVEASGASSVKYKGNAVVKQSVSGAGSVSKE